MSGAVTSDPETMRLARDERADLADFLVTLIAEQWDAPTLCTRWRVRDVVAHVFSYEDLGLFALLRRFAAARFDADRANALGVADYADHSPEDLLARVREHLKPSGLPARFGGRIALADGLIHHQDIRRPRPAPRRSGRPAGGGVAVRGRSTAHRCRQAHPGAPPRRHRPGLEHR